MENTLTLTPQDRMRQKLASVGLRAREIKVYGSQIMITAMGRITIQRWASLLAKFAKVNAIIEAHDYNVENTNTVLLPSTHKVWRVWATV